MTWNPERYLAFGDQRTRPAVDLLARIALDAPARVVDLGCGPGNSTRLLADRWPGAAITAVDHSAEMLAKARTSDVRAVWIEADIAAWAPDQPLDLVYSNAALQWLGDHGTLLPRLLGHVRPGGALAVQMPRSFESPSHRLARAVARQGPWSARLAGYLRAEPLAAPEWYHDLLAPHAAALDIWETEYLHVLEGDDPVLRWTRGTALRPIAQALDDHDYAAFEATLAARLREAYPKRPDGRTLYPFRRLFIIARR